MTHGDRGRSARGLSTVMPIVVALIVFGMGAVNIVSALIGIELSRLRLLYPYLPLEVRHGTRTLTVLAGWMLILLSWSLLRRKRRGWLAAVVLLAVSIALNLLKGLDYEEALTAAGVLAVLLATRAQFRVRSDPRGWVHSLMVSLYGAAGVLAYGVLGFGLLQRDFTPAVTFARAWASTVALLLQTGAPPLQPLLGHRDALWFLDSLVAALFVWGLSVAVALLRPVAAALSQEHGREEAAKILRLAGGPPLAYWTLLPGLHYCFNADHTAFLAYRLVDGCALVLGDPHGATAAIPGLVATFAVLCRENDWRPAWYQTTGRWGDVFRAQGWHRVKLGEDALIDLSGLAFTGRNWQSVRTALHRLPRDGYTAVWYDLHADLRGWLPALEAISAGWLREQHGSEKGFSLGTWRQAQRFAAEQRCLVLADPHGQPAAFLTFVPIYGASGGWALDLMRRAPSAAPGAMEFLLATALQAFRDEGASVVSLGLSPLASVTPDEIGEPELLERVRQLIYTHFRRFYNFQGLNFFKQKFTPRWEPRYLVYPTLIGLPRVIMTLMRAHNVPHRRDADPPSPLVTGRPGA